MKKVNSIFTKIKNLSGPTSLLGISGMASVTLVAYALAEKAGLFSPGPRTWVQVLHSPYAIVLASFCFFPGLGGTCALALAKIRRKERYGDVLLFFMGGTALYAALWLSVLFRFEGRAILSERESFQAFPTNYVRETIYRGRYAGFPKIGFTVVSIRPELSRTGESLNRVDAEVLYSSKNTRGIREGLFSSARSRLVDWTLFRITDFGYRPTIVLSDEKGMELERRDVNMKLFPPGAEEYYEPMFLGYLIYLQCYPDYEDRQGTAISRSAYLNNPVSRVRIVRNKDIVYNGLVKPTEHVKFDRVSIAVPEVKMWVEITLVREYAYPVLAAAGALLLAGATLTVARRRRG